MLSGGRSLWVTVQNEMYGNVLFKLDNLSFSAQLLHKMYVTASIIEFSVRLFIINVTAMYTTVW